MTITSNSTPNFDSNLISSSDSKFRMSSKFFFLTYSQVGPITLHMITESFLKKSFLVNLDTHIFTLEHHKDGGAHAHVFLSFKKRLDLRSPAAFDLVYVIDSKKFILHPNVQKVKSVPNTVNYVIKGVLDPSQRTELNFFSNRSFEDIQLYVSAFVSDKPDKKAITNLNLIKLFTLIKSKGISFDNALDEISRINPSSFLLSYERIDRNLHLIFTRSLFRPYNHFGALYLFNFSPYFQVAVWHSAVKKDKVLCLWGPTNTGKTYLAHQLAGPNPLLVTTLQSFTDYNPNLHTGLIFDDFEFPKVSYAIQTGYEQNYDLDKPETSYLDMDGDHRALLLHLFDPTFGATVRVLYKSIIIPSNVIKIVTSNINLDLVLSHDPALHRRFLFVNVQHDLRSSKTKFSTPELKYCVDGEGQPRTKQFQCRSLPSLNTFFSTLGALDKNDPLRYVNNDPDFLHYNKMYIRLHKHDPHRFKHVDLFSYYLSTLKSTRFMTKSFFLEGCKGLAYFNTLLTLGTYDSMFPPVH
jgi:hypothetical protein